MSQCDGLEAVDVERGSCRTGHCGTADHPSLRPARRTSARPHGGNRLIHRGTEILQCAAGLRPWWTPTRRCRHTATWQRRQLGRPSELSSLPGCNITPYVLL